VQEAEIPLRLAQQCNRAFLEGVVRKMYFSPLKEFFSSISIQEQMPDIICYYLLYERVSMLHE
jgi:hypothetical protein